MNQIFYGLLEKYKYLGVLPPVAVSILSIVNILRILNKLKSLEAFYFVKPFLLVAIFSAPAMVLILWLFTVAFINFLNNLFIDTEEEESYHKLFFGIGFGFAIFFIRQILIFAAIEKFNFAGNIGCLLEFVRSHKFPEISAISFLVFSMWCVVVNKTIYKTKIFLDIVILAALNFLYFLLNIFQLLWRNFSG